MRTFLIALRKFLIGMRTLEKMQERNLLQINIV